MTIGELIEKLNNLPKETPVLLSEQFGNLVDAKFTYYDESRVIINQHGWARNKKKEDGPLALPL